MDICYIIELIFKTQEYEQITEIIPKDQDSQICKNLFKILRHNVKYKGEFLAYHALQRYLFKSSLFKTCIKLSAKYGLSYRWLYEDICPKYNKKIAQLFWQYCINIKSINCWDNSEFTILLHLAGDSINIDILNNLLEYLDNKKAFTYKMPHEMICDLYEERADVKAIFIEACDLFKTGKLFMKSIRFVWIQSCICLNK